MASRLGKQLATEFRRAGKKSLVLAALFAVGLCIWMPMLWKSLVHSRGSTPRATTTESAVRTNPTFSREIVATTEAAPPDWKRLHRRVEKSDIVQPLALDDLVRDPFDRGWIREKKNPPVTKSEAELATNNDPERFLVLSATLAGNGGAAIISDRVYRIGQEVPNEGPIRFVLRDVRPDRVVLERAGSRFELHLKDSNASTKDKAELTP